VRWLTFLLLVSQTAFSEDILVKAFTAAPLIRQGKYTLWRDPGRVQAIDFRYGVGGPELVPKPPFQFVDEDLSGTDAKIKVKDSNDRTWVVKLGHESRPDTFCTRLAWSLGYYVEPNYLVADGVIEGVKNLQRARKEIEPDGRFQNGRFQLRTATPKYLRSVDWSWDENPFLGTPELGGLKIVMMLLSNWDNKDNRDAESRGSNTAIFQQNEHLFYFIEDWGGAMGNWGKYLTRSKWNSKSFLHQSSEFVRLDGGEIRWGYSGQHTALLKRDIRPSDITWLLKYLEPVTDTQLRTGLLSSGASEEETRDYVQGLRLRIQQLQHVAAP
jgi:hypothetical protein